jgi:hypothetical protein
MAVGAIVVACGGKRSLDGAAPVSDGGAEPDGSTADSTIDVSVSPCPDPARSQPAYRDGDGDGWTVGVMECFESLPEGYAKLPSLWEDCDDANPEVNRVAYADADGDGYGAAVSGSLCAPASEHHQRVPEGFAWSSVDCDDSDGATHPQATEHWRDGRDSDCNGRDDPLRCGTEFPDECGCELLGIGSVEIDETCGGVDLFVAAQQGCEFCTDAARLIVGNRGTAAAANGFVLELDVNVDTPDEFTERREFLDVLPAGSVTLPILMQDARRVRIVVAEAECEPDNNSEEVTPSGGACAP